MRIYTKTGDGGETGLIGGARIRKDDPVMEVLGALDELNASFGLVLSGPVVPWMREPLTSLQHLLFEAGAEMAQGSESRPWIEDAERLERQIDVMTAELPPLRHFVLPGGSPAAASLHVARGICRRVERSLVGLDYNLGRHPGLRTFLNRLSDWLFCAARLANQEEGVPDVRWIKQ